MTPEQLDEIEKLADVEHGRGLDFGDLIACRNAINPLVKALREATERDEHHFKVLEQYRLEVEDYKRRMGDLLDQLAREEADAHQFQKERDEALAEVDRLKAELAESHERRLGWAQEVGKIAAERADLKAEVERLHELLQRVQKLAWSPSMDAIREIRELTQEGDR